MDATFHYPPEVMSLLIEAIPKLFKGKKQVILFFRGAGTNDAYTRDMAAQVERDPASISKRDIATKVLASINEGGEKDLRARREIIRQITQFEDYSSCWPADQMVAKGYVAELKRVVNVKDSFTRINEERDAERRERLREQEARRKESERKRRELTTARTSLGALYLESDPFRRGKALEAALNALFRAAGISVREAFTLIGGDGEGVVEQVDGVVEIDGHLYLVEMKWWKQALGTAEIAPHLVRLFNRGEARGIFIAVEGYTGPAVTECKGLLSQKVIVLCALRSIMYALEQDRDLNEYFRERINAAQLDRNPFFDPPTHT